ncbi:MAG: hypothetical protein NC089_11655 [Bacteroides sp.]|nr:hypothetical protein [Bacteroides sp.]MCM1549198.1 dihydropteridine reductase [Clostridium sp.]
MNTDKIYAEAIVNEYSKKSASKVVALRKLDAAAKRPANIFAYSFGIVVALILGVGMCLSMKVIGSGTTVMIGIGVVLGVLGIVGCAANYFIYKKLLKNGKEKFADDIIHLANEIANESKD